VVNPTTLDFSKWTQPVPEILEQIGEMPLPPYIHSRIPARDRDRYQPVWALANQAGSVAAPTASLHFDAHLEQSLTNNGAAWADVVLHVGLGTFEPVRTPKLSEHQLHYERLLIPARTQDAIAQAKSAQKPVVAVGTTALRTLESINTIPLESLANGDLMGRTNLFIRPPFEFQIASALWTNFHLPESTLLVLVATFAGSRDLALRAYRHAVNQRYRFFSYGDASLWI
jgi:S-adenosylmethionine:tRNA ribosyltransferase-isomerase